MVGEIYKNIEVKGMKIDCIDEISGYTLQFPNGEKYNVYGDNEGTEVDFIAASNEREYVGKVSDDWTGDEGEVAQWILQNVRR